MRGNRSTNVEFSTAVSKTIFLFANLHFSKQIKNGFCGIEVQKLKFGLSAPLLAIRC